MNQDYEKLMQYWDRQMALQTAMTLFGWDNETLAPKLASERTSRVLGILSDELYRQTVNEEVRELYERLSGADDLTEHQMACVKKMQEGYEKMTVIPPEENRAFSELMASSTIAWAKARQNNDFQAFLPVLKEVIEFQKKFASYRQKEGMTLYEALLGQYEKGFSEKDLDRFFGRLKEEIVPLLQQAVEKNDRIDKSYNSRQFPVEKQKEFNCRLAQYLGFDYDKGVIAESAHPFTTNLHNQDVRITSHYKDNDLEAAIFSTVHETGHALYEFGIPDELSQTPLGQVTSMGLHESQSRFFENMIGRSEAFWQPLFGKLKETYAEQLADVSLEQFIRGINKAQPGPIRILADELTYCLHIMIRYELEKKLINENLEPEKLPELWKQMYEEYLGITPENDAAGVLQDIHWSQGSFGYFPSYALGNAYAAQIYHRMRQELDVDRLLQEGNLAPIREFLYEHIHRHGNQLTSREILKELTGEEFNSQYYIDYLKEKYSRLYEL